MQRIAEEIEKLRLNNQLRIIPNIEAKLDGKIIVDGCEFVNFASNDYLGISTKSDLREEFLSKFNDRLFSSASARLLTGSSDDYSNLEKTVADLFNKDAALIFNTGYQANLGVITSLIDRNDVIFSDKLNHASIIDGIQLAKGDFFRYKHLDYDNLEKLLATKREQYGRALIVSESIFSMDGDLADINKLIELKNKYNCLLMIDEAHAFCASKYGLAGYTYKKDVDIVTATFGKAVGSFGAFCVSNKDIISYLVNKARSFIFSTSIPPINVAWSNWLLNDKKDYLLSQNLKLQNLISSVHRILKERNIVTPSVSHIIPVILGDNNRTIKISEKLKSLGYYIPAIRPPTVPEGTSRLRISLTADCSISDFENVLNNLN